MAVKGKQRKTQPAVYSSESLMLYIGAGIVLIALGVIIILAVLVGMEGTLFQSVRQIAYGIAGSAAMVLPLLFLWGGMLFMMAARQKPPLKPFLLGVLIFLCLLALLNLFSSLRDQQSREVLHLMDYIKLTAARDQYSLNSESLGTYWTSAYNLSARHAAFGGALGMLLAWPLWTFLGAFPAIATLIVVVVALVILVTNVNLKEVFARFNEKSALRRQQKQYDYQQQLAYQQQMAAQQPVSPPANETQWQEPQWQELTPAPKKRNTRKPQMIDVVDMRGNKPEPLPWETEAEKPKARRTPVQRLAKQPPVPPDAEEPSPFEAELRPSAPRPRRPLAEEMPMSGSRIDQPDLILPKKKSDAAKQMEMELPAPYEMPPLNILKPPVPLKAESREEDTLRAKRLEETLESFKIPSRVRNVIHGPAIARYEVEIAAGINVSRVASVDRNLAMNLEVKSVRIEAPIPGKALVGVEVPNRVVTPVMLREVLESDVMRNHPSHLAVALGKDIAGEPIVCDLAAMPHVLIAGATGAGKSVCINSIINSILYRTTPEQVRMILVDPKVVELQCYNCVPHLLIPVISDPHKAAGALAWVVSEMMERYNRIRDRSVRDINGYNASLASGEEAMPRIVVIIDELADLMMQCKKEVEEYICRIAQLARAAGIHLVVATQRPSVDVITGLIKSNIPSRIAFTVSSSIDSRTILDRVGAEKLLGKGDMLYFPKGEGTPVRVQGCFLSDAEVNRVMDFMKRNNSPAEFDPSIIEKLEEGNNAIPIAQDDAGSRDSGGEGFDAILHQAIEMAVMDRQTSISMLQRRLRIGYARAGRVIDEMAKRGIIGQADGAKPRQVLISREEFEQMKEDSL